jgi:hypothetical protein
MKVRFEFDTTSEDFYNNFDHIKLYNMQTADDMAICLNALREKVRSLVKYDEREMISKDEIEEVFWEIIKDHNINFEKMGY